MKNNFKQQLEKIKTQRKLLLILIFAFIATVVWIGGSIFMSQQKTKISDEVKLLARPLTPSLDVEVFERIETKKTYSDEDLTEFPIYKIEEDGESGEFQVMTVQGEVIEGEAEEDSLTNLVQNRIEQATSSAESTNSSSMGPADEDLIGEGENLYDELGQEQPEKISPSPGPSF
jgi:hypothetical protein